MYMLDVQHESWPIAGKFTISRGSRTSAEVVVVTLTDARLGIRGRGECVPYARYGETVEGVMADLRAQAGACANGQLDRKSLQTVMKPGAARNALDAAFWDLEAKSLGRPVWQLAGLPEPKPTITAETISLDTPEAMGQAAQAKSDRPLLKVKLGHEGVLERVAAIRNAAPESALIVDANEAMPVAELEATLAGMADLGVSMVEQPLPAGQDDVLGTIKSPVPLCADESSHTADDIPHLAKLYDLVNVKLDKTGGLTGAIAMVKAAQEANLGVMIGCMLGTSLAMSPAYMLTPFAKFVDLDGPVLLAKDREYGLDIQKGRIAAPLPDLWG